MEITIRKANDFEVAGDGSAAAWHKAKWEPLTLLPDNESPYDTRFKMLYSATGIYVLFDCQDDRLTCIESADFDDLWTQDVVEVFLWPGPKQPLYFEYELSPVGTELPILVPNHEGEFMGWRPWHYEGIARFARPRPCGAAKKSRWRRLPDGRRRCLFRLPCSRGLPMFHPRQAASGGQI